MSNLSREPRSRIIFVGEHVRFVENLLAGNGQRRRRTESPLFNTIMFSRIREQILAKELARQNLVCHFHHYFAQSHQSIISPTLPHWAKERSENAEGQADASMSYLSLIDPVLWDTST